MKLKTAWFVRLLRQLFRKQRSTIVGTRTGLGVRLLKLNVNYSVAKVCRVNFHWTGQITSWWPATTKIYRQSVRLTGCDVTVPAGVLIQVFYVADSLTKPCLTSHWTLSRHAQYRHQIPLVYSTGFMRFQQRKNWSGCPFMVSKCRQLVFVLSQSTHVTDGQTDRQTNFDDTRRETIKTRKWTYFQNSSVFNVLWIDEINK